jgi:hypothetical protein
LDQVCVCGPRDLIYEEKQQTERKGDAEQERESMPGLGLNGREHCNALSTTVSYLQSNGSEI